MMPLSPEKLEIKASSLANALNPRKTGAVLSDLPQRAQRGHFNEGWRKADGDVPVLHSSETAFLQENSGK